ncbi:hypothetical protein K474DRAFT_1775204 [Panus rudis PR-1116 ss-1]|nr:hypothetical protein K474DRAFT_1775204 [Panus rudis PR-1116 ss-1]
MAQLDVSMSTPPSVPQAQLTLPDLLNPTSWQLPGWQSPSSPSEQSSDQPLQAETLDRLDASLALLLRYRNSLRPFSRLSSDILVLIFTELARDSSNPRNNAFGAYPWMGVSQVCYVWRSVALTTPILWTSISTRFRTAALACLERSGEAALSLVVSDRADDTKASAVLTAVLPHMHRIRHLHVPCNMLKVNNGTIHQMLEPLLTSEAPLLETFETIKERAMTGWTTLPTLFSGRTPNLTHLKVHYMLPQPTCAMLSKLRVLSFCGRKHSPVPLPVSDFIDLIEHCPLLEFIIAGKTTFSPARDDDKRQVRLDHLKLLQLGRVKASSAADIINRLIIPECSLDLKVWFERYDNNKFFMGIPLPQDLEPTHHLRDIRKMHVAFMNGYEGIDITCQTANSPFRISGILEQDTLANLGDMDSISGIVFQSLIKAFDLENLEELAFTEVRNTYRWSAMSKSVWMDTFRRMPKLKTLQVTTDGGYDEGYCRSILAALSERDDVTGRLFCPALENLHVWQDKTWSTLRVFMMAKERAESGHPLKRVSMQLSHYTSFNDSAETDLPILRQYVERVDLEPSDLEFRELPASP